MFIKNLDSGMRRLGFLQVMLSKCSSESQQTSATVMGERLWEWANKNQDHYLNKIAASRGLKEEVGKITPSTASRYVKYGTELGFLTSGNGKQLTDDGRLFKLFYKSDFVIDENLGQQILFIVKLFARDDLFMLPFIQMIHSSKLSKLEIFDWFAKTWVPGVIKNESDLQDADLIKRLKDSIKKYLSIGSEKKRGYDQIKHVVETRIENLVDLGLITKTSDKKFAGNKLTRILSTEYEENAKNQEWVFHALAKCFNVSKPATKTRLIQSYVSEYDKISNPPLESVYLPSLHLSMFVQSIIDGKDFVLPSMAQHLEEELFKKHYDKIVFMRNLDGALTHVNMDKKVKSTMRNGVL